MPSSELVKILQLDYSMPIGTDWDGPLSPSMIGMCTQASYCGSEYSLAKHYQILTSFTGGKVLNSKN